MQTTQDDNTCTGGIIKSSHHRIISSSHGRVDGEQLILDLEPVLGGFARHERLHQVRKLVHSKQVHVAQHSTQGEMIQSALAFRA